jgi:tetratricopeptide (TPR) repeat protein
VTGQPRPRAPDPALLSSRASALFEQRRFAEAIDCLKQLCGQPQASASAWLRLLMLLELTGRLEEAAAVIPEARKRAPGNPGLALMEAKILHRQNEISKAIAVLEPAMRAIGDSPADNPFHYELGRLYDRSGAYDKAFACFTTANKTMAGTPAARSYDSGALRAALLRIREELAPGCVSPQQTGGAAPVFLVGFPRSGTTLLDQILSSHPQAVVAEEKPVIGKVIVHLMRAPAAREADCFANPDYPRKIFALPEAELEAARRMFFEDHEQAGAVGKVFVDKLPLNLLHAGVIRKLFPGAKFILALRHPCDAVLSCYMQEFRLNPFMARFLDIQDAANFYDEAFGLWNRYTEVFDLDVHAVRYEDVVGDFRPAVSALLQFLGLAWNDAVLEFDKTARAKERINTPSYHQVTQKIYTRASGRWLKYRKHLESVLPILEPWALKHGYAMDEQPAEKQ